MKVDELRTVLAKYDAVALSEIVVALYKTIPKIRKENDGLDELITNFTRVKSKIVKKDKTVDFEELKGDVEQFIGYANEQYYFAPNRYVSKGKRSKWRFEAKRLIKELISVTGENSEIAAQLLVGMYGMLSYGCHYYIFSTYNPFSAVGYEQPKLLQHVLEKIFCNGVDKAGVRTAVYLTLDSNNDRETLHYQLLHTLAASLKTSDTIELALEQCVAFIKEYDSYQAGKTLFRYDATDKYRRDRHINLAVELYVILKFNLYEYDEGIKYFWENYIERNSEITLYCLLAHFLSGDDLKDLWIREYEKAIQRGIKPREILQDEYAKRKAGTDQGTVP